MAMFFQLYQISVMNFLPENLLVVKTRKYQ